MGRVVLLVLVGILLAGCAPVETLGGSTGELPRDPNELIMDGYGYQTSTAQAAYERAAQSTEQAAKENRKTANEIAVIMAPITAEAARVNLQLTANAERRVEEDRKATATSAAVTAVYNAGQATATAIAYTNEANRTVYWGWFMAFLIVGTVVGVIIIAYLLIRHWEDAMIDQAQQKLDLERQRYALRLIGGKTWWINAQGRPVPLNQEQTGNVTIKTRTINPGIAGNGQHNTQALAVQLVGKGIELFGEQSIEIPSRIEMDWSPGKWTRVTKPLKELSIIDTIEGQRTFLADGGPYVNLQQLYWDLVDMKLLLKPSSPTQAWSVAGD